MGSKPHGNSVQQIVTPFGAAQSKPTSLSLLVYSKLVKLYFPGSSVPLQIDIGIAKKADFGLLSKLIYTSKQLQDTRLGTQFS